MAVEMQDSTFTKTKKKKICYPHDSDCWLEKKDPQGCDNNVQFLLSFTPNKNSILYLSGQVPAISDQRIQELIVGTILRAWTSLSNLQVISSFLKKNIS